MAKEINVVDGPNGFSKSFLSTYYETASDWYASLDDELKIDYPESWSAAADDYEVAEDLI